MTLCFRPDKSTKYPLVFMPMLPWISKSTPVSDPLLSTLDGPLASLHSIKLPKHHYTQEVAFQLTRCEISPAFTQLPLCSAFCQRGFVFFQPVKGKSQSMRAHDRCACASVLTHLDCSTMISIWTFASSFLLTKPISSSASAASTSTTGWWRESFSRSCVCVVHTGWWPKQGEKDKAIWVWKKLTIFCMLIHLIYLFIDEV